MTGLFTRPLPAQSAKDFFSDCPWLQVPEHRRAIINIEPVYSHRGLLGGSSKDGKMSKLAALAAKRRQKENEKPVVSSVNQPAKSGDLGANLSKLSLTSSHAKSREEALAEDPTTQSGQTQLRSDVPEPMDGVVQSPHDAVKGFSSENPEPAMVARAAPSMFAKIVLGGNPSIDSSSSIVLPDETSGLFATFGPSPDDVINKAQRTKGHS